jgi:hypothetical protein
VALLDDIENAALDPKVRVADALRKVIALGGQAGSADLRDWAAQELNGYPSSADVPDYRIIPAIIAIDLTTPRAHWTQRQIAPRNLPEGVRDRIREEVHITSPIAEIDDLASHNEAIKLSLPDAATICQVMNYEIGDPYQQIHAVYWVVSPTSYRALADQVRTKLTSLVAEMRATTPRGQQTPSAEAATQAVEVVIKGGKRHNININTTQGDDSPAIAAATQGNHLSATASSISSTGERSRRWVWGALGAAGTVVLAVVAVIGLLH